MGRRSYDPASYAEMFERMEHYESVMRLQDLGRLELAALPLVLRRAVSGAERQARHARLLAVGVGALATVESLALIANAVGFHLR